MLVRHGVERQATAHEPGRAVVVFEKEGRRVRFEMALPAGRDFQDTRNPQKEWEQACREKWRALLLALKAKFVSLETGIETFEEAFLAHIVLPGGGRVGEWMAPQLRESYASGRMPPLLPSGTTEGQ